ncbi:MAG TPA: hypothetical protein VFU65_08055 [Actinocrinis sp.]|nr:hypothetical protein [Actinocrinis sp.]
MVIAAEPRPRVRAAVTACRVAYPPVRAVITACRVAYPRVGAVVTTADSLADRVPVIDVPESAAALVARRTPAHVGTPRAGQDALARRASVGRQCEAQVAAHRPVRISDRRVEQQPNLAHRSAQRAVRTTVEQRLAAPPLEFHHPAQQHRFSGPRTAEHPGHLPGTHIEADRVEYRAATSPYCQVDGFDHARRLLDVRCPIELTSLRSSGAGGRAGRADTLAASEITRMGARSR